MGIVIAASAVASAQSAPSLPPRSAAQLLADVAHAKPLGEFTATIQQTSNLGLPALPTAASQDAGAPAALTSGQGVSIWYRDPQHIRLAVPVQAGESDLRLDGRTVWLWNSKTQTATHVVLPAHFSAPGNGAGIFPSWHSGSSSSGPADLPNSPLAAARKLLAAIGPSTSVTVQRNVYVAGRAAYQLSVAPKASGSLVGKILIAIDASKYIPLRVQVFARGASSPAFAVGFTALTFGPPAMSNFTFTPPPGATVKTERIPSRLPVGVGKLVLGRAALNKLAIGKLGVARLKATKLRLLKLCGPKPNAPTSACAQLRITVVNPAPAKGGSFGQTTYPQLVKRTRLPKQVIRRIEASFARSLPKAMPQAQRAKIIKGFDQQFSKGFPMPPGSAAAIKNMGEQRRRVLQRADVSCLRLAARWRLRGCQAFGHWQGLAVGGSDPTEPVPGRCREAGARQLRRTGDRAGDIFGDLRLVGLRFHGDLLGGPGRTELGRAARAAAGDQAGAR